LDKYGIREGQEIGVLFYRDEEFLGAVVMSPGSSGEIGIQVHYYKDEDLVVLTEAAASALGALRYESDKPRLRKMIAARIEELNALDEDEVEGNPPTHRQSIVSLLHFNS